MKPTYIQILEEMRKRELTDRQQVVYSTIGNNPQISQNNLKKIIVPKYMAGKTFEKELKNLTENNFVFVERIKNRKHFTTSTPIPNHERHVLTALGIRLNILESRIAEIENKFSKYSIIRQNTIIFHLLKNLQNIGSMIELESLLFDRHVTQHNNKVFKNLANRTFTLARSMKRDSIFSLFHFVMSQEMLSSQDLKRYIDDDSLFDVKPHLEKTS
jgi:hypothetical protein